MNRELINTIKVSNITHESGLRINFGKSLRLISFQDLISLFDTCQNKGIKMFSMEGDYLYQLFDNAIDISCKHNNDVRLLAHCKTSFGEPFSSKILSLNKTFDSESISLILNCLIENQFNMNATDSNNGESIVYSLVKNFDKKNLSSIINNFSKQHKHHLFLNTYNRDGLSPLFYAIRYFRNEKDTSSLNQNVDAILKDNIDIEIEKHQKISKPDDKAFIYEILINNKSDSVASVNFPACDKPGNVISPLGLAVNLKHWDIVKLLLRKGAILNTTETSLLPKIYLQLASDKNMHEKIDSQLKLTAQQSGLKTEYICDSNGNNPLHLLCNTSDAYDLEKFGISMKKLVYVCPQWLLQENNKQEMPIALLIDSVNSKNTQKLRLLLDCLDSFRMGQKIKRKLVLFRINESESSVYRIRSLLLDWINGDDEMKVDEVKVDEAKVNDADNNKSNYNEMKYIFDTFESCICNKYHSWFNVFNLYQFANETEFNNAVNQVNEFLNQQYSYTIPSVDIVEIQNRVTIHVRESTVATPNSSKRHNYSAVFSDVDEEKGNSNYANGLQVNDPNLSDANVDADTGLNGRATGETNDDFNNSAENDKSGSTWIELLYVFIVECLSSADLVTDMFVLIQLIDSNEQWLVALNIFFMMSPYLVSYTALGSIVMRHYDNSIWSVIALTPLCLIYFVILDIIFMIYAVLSTILYLISLSIIDIRNCTDTIFFTSILGLSRMEINGYRRLRTLAQLQFETFPQIVVQLYMLQILDFGGTGHENTLEVSYESLYFSLMFASLHFTMESMMLYLDSKACYISLEQYAVICLNARLSWVPFSNLLVKDDVNAKHTRYLDYEHIVSTVCRKNYKLDFEFSKNSWQIFIKYIGNVGAFSPNLMLSEKKNNYNVNNRDGKTYTIDSILDVMAPVICDTYRDTNKMHKTFLDIVFDNSGFGSNYKYSTSKRNMRLFNVVLGQQCCKNINVADFYKLYQIASNKVILSCNDINWKAVVSLPRRNKIQKKESTELIQNMISDMLTMGDLRSINDICKYNQINDEYSVQELLYQLFDTGKLSILKNIGRNLLPLKRCYDNQILFGLQCSESRVLYSFILQLLKEQMLIDTIQNLEISNYTININQNTHNFYLAMLLLWYTQGNVSNHHCYECEKSWLDHIYDLNKEEISSTNLDINTRSNSSNLNIKEYTQQCIELLWSPLKIEIELNCTNPTRFHDPSKSIVVGVNTAENIAALNRLFAEYLSSYVCILAKSGSYRIGNDNYNYNQFQSLYSRNSINDECILRWYMTQEKYSMVDNILKRIKEIDKLVSNQDNINNNMYNDFLKHKGKLELTGLKTRHHSCLTKQYVNIQAGESESFEIGINQVIGEENGNGRNGGNHDTKQDKQHLFVASLTVTLILVFDNHTILQLDNDNGKQVGKITGYLLKPLPLLEYCNDALRNELPLGRKTIKVKRDDVNDENQTVELRFEWLVNQYYALKYNMKTFGFQIVIDCDASSTTAINFQEIEWNAVCQQSA